MYFDTETTGLVRKDLSPNHPDQPRIVQYAAILLAPDWTELASVNVLRKPYGWEIPSGAAAVHGISTAKAFAFGCEILSIISMWQSFVSSSVQVVAHNLEFDMKMMNIEGVREQVPLCIDGKQFFCTMKATTPICKLPGRRPGDYKWPKLTEAYEIFFGEKLEGAHDALVDVRACARVHRHLIEKGLVKDAPNH